METYILLHTEDPENFKRSIGLLKDHPHLSSSHIFIQSKNLILWENPELYLLIVQFKTHQVYLTDKNPVESVVEMIDRIPESLVFILDERCSFLPENLWVSGENDFIYEKKSVIVSKNIDINYKDLRWFLEDIRCQIKCSKSTMTGDCSDSDRLYKKIEDPLFFERIIFIDGGMGDHVMALPLLNKISQDVFICCKYPQVFRHLPFKGHVPWGHELFGGYSRFVYSYGSSNNSKTIVDAFFGLYGVERKDSDVLIYTGTKIPVEELESIDSIALISTSASRQNGKSSNKDWVSIRWMKLVNEMKEKGFYVIQVGSFSDDQIPNVDFKFLDRPLENLSWLINKSSIWVCVDTFFHHFAAAIKPEVGFCLTPFYNDHAKHPYVTYIEKDCGKNFHGRRWWLDAQQPERKECMELIKFEEVLEILFKRNTIKIYCGNRNVDNCSNWRAYMQYKDIPGYDFEFSNTLDFDISADSNYDAIIFIRPCIRMINYIRDLKKREVKIIVDLDDCLPLLFSPENIVEHLHEAIDTINEADVITTTTEKLKNYFYYHSYKKDIHVLPNVIDPDVVSQNKKDNGDKIVLGWFGNSGHFDNLVSINQEILRVLDKYENVHLNVYSDSEKIFDLFNHERTQKIPYEFNFENFQEKIGEIDINLAPMVDSYFNFHKSNIRIILPGFKGIPSVVSNFSEYKDLGNYVTVCNSAADWFSNICYLIENKEHRKEMGEKIKNYVENNLTTKLWKLKRLDALKSV